MFLDKMIQYRSKLHVKTVFGNFWNIQLKSQTATLTSKRNTVQGSSCNAVYGNIAGNKHNLGKLMADNLKQSFQFIAMVNRNLVINVCSKKKCTKRSSVLLLRLVYFFSERTLSLILRHSEVSNNRAALFILFWDFSYLHDLNRHFTIIYSKKKSTKFFVTYINDKK